MQIVSKVCVAAQGAIIDLARCRKSALLSDILHRILLSMLHELPLATGAVPWDRGLVLYAFVVLKASVTFRLLEASEYQDQARS